MMVLPGEYREKRLTYGACKCDPLRTRGWWAVGGGHSSFKCECGRTIREGDDPIFDKKRKP